MIPVTILAVDPRDVAAQVLVVPQYCADAIAATTPLTPEFLAGLDCVLIATDHSAYDYDMIVRNAPLIIDTRNATKNITHFRDKICKA